MSKEVTKGTVSWDYAIAVPHGLDSAFVWSLEATNIPQRIYNTLFAYSDIEREMKDELHLDDGTMFFVDLTYNLIS